MQELKKILEEINYRINEYVDHDYVRGSGDVVKGLSIAKSIVRKHLSRENTTEITRCSRDTQGAEHEINLPKEEFEMLRFSDSVTFRCGNEYVSLYMGEDEATREYKIVDDGWILVDERMPTQEECKDNLFWITYGYFSSSSRVAQCQWVLSYDENGNDDSYSEFYIDQAPSIYVPSQNLVTAWKIIDIPEPYRLERSERK